MKHKAPVRLTGFIESSRSLAFLFRYAVKYAPGYFVATVLYSFLHWVLVFFEHTWSLKIITDAIQYGRPFSTVVVYIFFIICLVGISLFFGMFYYHWFQIRGRERIHLGMRKELLAKAATMDIAHYDDTEHYDDFVWAVSEAPDRLDEALDKLSAFESTLACVIVPSVFILLYDSWGFAFILVSSLLSFLAQGALSKAQFATDADNLPHKRKLAYYARIFYGPDHAKELRLSKVSELIKDDFDATVKAIDTNLKVRSKRQVVLGFLADFCFSRFIVNGLYVGYIVIRTVVLKQLSYGDMLALFRSVSGTTSDLQDLGGQISDFRKIALYAEKIRRFLAAEPTITAPSSPRTIPSGPWELEFQNVSFAYPTTSGSHASPCILKDISLRTRQGEKLAIVGHNGAGKTTLIKLIMRLYDPSEGRILLNGIDIREFSPEEYRTLIGSVFQDFQIFAASLAENVLLDALSGAESTVVSALGKSGFGERLAKMRGGIDTPLTREFDSEGENLSGGENQKVAISRVFAKQSNLAILDEPSSALDPESEYNLNRTMRDAARDKGVFFISHRLSSTLMADRIILLEEGRIVEEGSHAKLMAYGGRYAKMFELQAARYRPPAK